MTGIHSHTPDNHPDNHPGEVVTGNLLEDTSHAVVHALENSMPSIWIDGDSIRELIAGRIQNLPPLPRTIIAINELRNAAYYDSEELLKIIQTDPMIVANILKISNSAMYGFSKQVKSASDALKILWFKIVSNIAVITAISSYLKPNLAPYGVDMEGFTDISATQSKIIDKWNDPKIAAIKTDLQFAAFLQEVGIIIISMVIIEKNLTQLFKKQIEECDELSMAEENILGQSSAEITSLVFSHWKFNQKLIDYIKYSDKPENSEESFRAWSQALKIAKILAPVNKDGITPETIAKAAELVASYSFDADSFKELTDWLSERIA